MRFSARTLIHAAIATACLFCCMTAEAKKPGGGGTDPVPGDNGGGLIYFRFNADLYTMNDDGSGVTRVAGFPANYLHDDHFAKDSYLARETAAGRDRQRLTDSSFGFGMDPIIPLGWRP